MTDPRGVQPFDRADDVERRLLRAALAGVDRDAEAVAMREVKGLQTRIGKNVGLQAAPINVR